MKPILPKRTAKPSAPVSSSSPAEPGAPPKYTPRGTGSKKRIVLAVKDDRIDFEAMGKDGAKELNDLLHKPEVQAQFGIGPLTQGFDPRHCKRIYQAAGNVLYGMGRLVAKWPAEACAVLHFSDAEQEELAKPTATVLDEIAPQWLRENQALGALILVFGSIMQNKMREAAMLAAAIAKAKADGTWQPPVNPTPVVNISSGRVPINSAVNVEATQEERFGGPRSNGKTEVPTAASGINLGSEISGASPRQ